MIVRNDSIVEASISELPDYQVIYDAVFPYDPDVQTYIDAAGLTDVTQKEAINTLVLGLKAENIWNKIDLIMPILGGTEQSHLTNLKGPGTWLSFGSWTHSAEGMIGGGTNSFILPSVDMSAYTHALELDVHVGAYVSQPSSTVLRMVGGIMNNLSDGYARLGIGFLGGNQFYGGAYGDLTEISWATGFDRFIVVNSYYPDLTPNPNPPATAWATASVYKNAVPIITSASGAWSPISGSYNDPFCIGALYWAGQGYPHDVYLNGTFDGYIKYLSIGGGLSSAEISTYNTLVEAYQTALGRSEA